MRRNIDDEEEKYLDGYLAIKYIYYFFILNLILSFFYAFFKGNFNGDFLGVPVELDLWILFFNFFISLVPFIFLWQCYSYFKANSNIVSSNINLKLFGWVTLVAIHLNIFVTITYGVGIMAAPPYEAPPLIKVFIQLLNRFNCSYAVLLYFLASSKKNKFQFLLLFLLLFLSFLRAGLGIILYIVIFSIVKYFEEFVFFIRRHKIQLLILMLISPSIISLLFNLRSILRNGEIEDLTGLDFLIGRFCGRLSSFSDSGFILQEVPFFLLNSQQLDFFYFQKQMLSGVFSMDFLPDPRPEKMLFNFFYEGSSDNVAYMAGTQGNLIISFFRSPIVFLYNLLTIIITTIATFKISKYFSFKFSIEYAFLLLIYVILSGVANEFAFVLFSVLFFNFIFLIFRLLRFK
jgi:hypothetical protein